MRLLPFALPWMDAALHALRPNPDGPDDLDALRAAVADVGYGVCPSARGRGLARGALVQILALARQAGVATVIASCDPENLASAAVLRHGGLVEVEPLSAPGVRRWRLDLGERESANATSC